MAQFSDLPAELHLKISAWAIPEPRVVPIKYIQATLTYVARMHPPAILQINQENRYEALKTYQELRLGVARNHGCYVDLTGDAIYLSSDLDGTDFLQLCEKCKKAFEWRIEKFKWNQAHVCIDGRIVKTINYFPTIPFRHGHVIAEDLVHMDEENQIMPRMIIEYELRTRV
jgi:hypothetical protein